MKNTAIVASIGLVLVLFAWPAQSQADETLDGITTKFRLGILSVDDVSFVLPSVIVLDEKARLKPLELVVTNHTKKKHGFAIDKMKVKEIFQPGETKSIKVPKADLGPLAGTEGKGYRTYDPLDAAGLGMLIYFLR